MASNTIVLSNGTGQEVLNQLNAIFPAISSWQYGSTDPSAYAVAGMMWVDTGNNLIKQRNSANTAWITQGSFDATTGAITWNNATSAVSAATLQTARTIGLTGFATGSGSFDGSGNLSIVTTGSISNATESTAGIAKIATTAQAKALTDDTTIMTPAKIPSALNATGFAPLYACRAWVNFNGQGTVAIRGSGNVSSITDNGTGKYTINFGTNMPNIDYAVTTAVDNQGAAGIQGAQTTGYALDN